ncbi:MAG: hypothetical protein MJ206_03785 [Bacilli bacterium]|nr:hypothetical protein [Bacilli bacterium]
MKLRNIAIVSCAFVALTACKGRASNKEALDKIKELENQVASTWKNYKKVVLAYKDGSKDPVEEGYTLDYDGELQQYTLTPEGPAEHQIDAEKCQDPLTYNYAKAFDLMKAKITCEGDGFKIVQEVDIMTFKGTYEYIFNGSLLLEQYTQKGMLGDFEVTIVDTYTWFTEI